MHSIFGLFPRSLTILRGIVVSPTLLSLHKRKEGRKEGVEREEGRRKGARDGRKEGRKETGGVKEGGRD